MRQNQQSLSLWHRLPWNITIKYPEAAKIQKQPLSLANDMTRAGGIIFSTSYFLCEWIFHLFQISLNKCLLFAVNRCLLCAKHWRLSRNSRLVVEYKQNKKEASTYQRCKGSWPLMDDDDYYEYYYYSSSSSYYYWYRGSFEFLIFFPLDIQVFGTSTEQLDYVSGAYRGARKCCLHLLTVKQPLKEDAGGPQALDAKQQPELLKRCQFIMEAAFSFWFVKLTFRPYG